MDTLPAGLNPVSRVTLARSSRAPGVGDRASSHVLRFRRIYILPTREGMGFVGAVSIMLLGSINYGNALGYALSFMLISASLVSMLHAVRNLAGLGLRRDECAPVFAGDTARFGLRVDNRNQRRRFGVLARITSRRKRGHDDEPAVHFHVDANSLKRIELPGVASKRGWFSPGRVTIATRFPLGLFRAWSYVDVGLCCLVYPHPAGQQALPDFRSGESGDQGSRGKGDDEFSGLRDYQLGDSARRVHWKAVARGQGIPVKVFSGSAAGVTWLRWQDAIGNDSEARLSQLSRWILDADAQNLRFGLVLPGIDIAPDSGDEHRHSCLEALALYDDASQ